jgi:hypothetical protein
MGPLRSAVMASSRYATWPSFGYSVFFPLTWMAIPDRSTALKLTRFFIYAGVVLAALVVIEVVTGIDLLVVEVGKRWLGSETIEIVGTDDVGGIIAASLVALVAYILMEPEQRWLNCACALCACSHWC